MTKTAEEILDEIAAIEDNIVKTMADLDNHITVAEYAVRDVAPAAWQKYVELKEKKIEIYSLAQKQIEALKAEVTAEVLQRQTTIKGTAIMAVYSKPRTTWDGDLLSGYAIAHPDILACRKVGDKGSVSYRKV